MAYVKVTKRLIKAICALVASVVLAIGVCLAWFAQNGKVEGNDLQSNTMGINIEEFTVTAYKLKNRTVQTTGVKYTVGDKVTGSTDVKMNAYGELISTSDTETALLLKFDYKFKSTSDKQYAIYAYGEDARGEITGEREGTALKNLKCALSSVVGFYEIGENESNSSVTVTQNNKALTEEEIPDTDSNLVTIASGISDEVIEGTFYCIIDYVEDKVYTQYYKALEIEGTTFSTPMDFDGDIMFYMAESPSEE